MTAVINLLAGPSAGKTTNTHALMAYMKEKRMNVECALEYAKDVVWKNPGYEKFALDDQISLFATQNARIYPLIGQVEFVVTDCPLLLSLVYLPQSHCKFHVNRQSWIESFNDIVLKTYHQYSNINYYIERGDRKFVQSGRVHDEEQSRQKDTEVLDMLVKYQIPFKTVSSWNEIVKDLNI
jgi:hypothetical protein